VSGDPTLERILAALAGQAVAGREATRDVLTAIAADVGKSGDPLHRCILGHYLADLQDDPAEELAWDLRALDAAAGLTDARLKAFHASLSVAGFLPSLQLNVAESYHRTGAANAARGHLDLATAALPALPNDGYGKMIRTGVARLRAKLDA
jgi:hypothetical protein